MKKNVIAILSLVIVVFIAGCTNNDPYGTRAQGEVLQQAPDFSLTTLEGNTITKADFEDKVVLMQVFAAWCSTCVIETRNIQQVRNQFSEKDLEIVFFDATEGETKEQIDDFRRRSVGDEGKWHWAYYDADILPAYGVRSLEQTFLINKEGELAYTDFGFTNPDAMSQVIQGLI